MAEVVKDELEFYSKFAKPLIFNLPDSKDRVLAAAWVKKIRNPNVGTEKLRTDYLKLLLFALQRRKLVGIFADDPTKYEQLDEFPPEFDLNDIAKRLIEKEYTERQDRITKQLRGQIGDYPPYTTDCSSDYREYVAAQDIPGFGVHCYYAISKDPVNLWKKSDKGIYPKIARSAVDTTSPTPGGLAGTSSEPSCVCPPKEGEKESECKKRAAAAKPPEPKKKRHTKKLGKTPPVAPLGTMPAADERSPPTWGSNLLEVKGGAMEEAAEEPEEPPIEGFGPLEGLSEVSMFMEEFRKEAISTKSPKKPPSKLPKGGPYKSQYKKKGASPGAGARARKSPQAGATEAEPEDEEADLERSRREESIKEDAMITDYLKEQMNQSLTKRKIATTVAHETKETPAQAGIPVTTPKASRSPRRPSSTERLLQDDALGPLPDEGDGSGEINVDDINDEELADMGITREEAKKLFAKDAFKLPEFSDELEASGGSELSDLEPNVEEDAEWLEWDRRLKEMEEEAERELQECYTQGGLDLEVAEELGVPAEEDLGALQTEDVDAGMIRLYDAAEEEMVEYDGRLISRANYEFLMGSPDAPAEQPAAAAPAKAAKRGKPGKPGKSKIGRPGQPGQGGKGGQPGQPGQGGLGGQAGKGGKGGKGGQGGRPGQPGQPGRSGVAKPTEAQLGAKPKPGQAKPSSSKSRIQPPGAKAAPPGSKLPAPGSKLPAPGSKLPAPGSKLPAPGSKPPAPGSRIQPPGSKLRRPGSSLRQPGQTKTEPPPPAAPVQKGSPEAGPVLSEYAKMMKIREKVASVVQEVQPDYPPGVERTPPIFSEHKRVREAAEGLVYLPEEFLVQEGAIEWKHGPEFFADQNEFVPFDPRQQAQMEDVFPEMDERRYGEEVFFDIQGEPEIFDDVEYVDELDIPPSPLSDSAQKFKELELYADLGDELDATVCVPCGGYQSPPQASPPKEAAYEHELPANITVADLPPLPKASPTTPPKKFVRRPQTPPSGLRESYTPPGRPKTPPSTPRRKGLMPPGPAGTDGFTTPAQPIPKITPKKPSPRRPVPMIPPPAPDRVPSPTAAPENVYTCEPLSPLLQSILQEVTPDRILTAEDISPDAILERSPPENIFGIEGFEQLDTSATILDEVGGAFELDDDGSPCGTCAQPTAGSPDLSPIEHVKRAVGYSVSQMQPSQLTPLGPQFLKYQSPKKKLSVVERQKLKEQEEQYIRFLFAGDDDTHNVVKRALELVSNIEQEDPDRYDLMPDVPTSPPSPYMEGYEESALFSESFPSYEDLTPPTSPTKEGAAPKVSRLLQPGQIKRAIRRPGVRQPGVARPSGIVPPGGTKLKQPSGIARPPGARPPTAGIPTPGRSGIPAPGRLGIPAAATSGIPTPGRLGIPAPGTSGIPAPGRLGIPAPGTSGIPAPGRSGIPAPGTSGIPAPGRSGIPAPGRTGVPQPGRSGIPAPGQYKLNIPKFTPVRTSKRAQPGATGPCQGPCVPAIARLTTGASARAGSTPTVESPSGSNLTPQRLEEFIHRSKATGPPSTAYLPEQPAAFPGYPPIRTGFKEALQRHKIEPVFFEFVRPLMQSRTVTTGKTSGKRVKLERFSSKVTRPSGVKLVSNLQRKHYNIPEEPEEPPLSPRTYGVPGFQIPKRPPLPAAPTAWAPIPVPPGVVFPKPAPRPVRPASGLQPPVSKLRRPASRLPAPGAGAPRRPSSSPVPLPAPAEAPCPCPDAAAPAPQAQVRTGLRPPSGIRPPSTAKGMQIRRPGQISKIKPPGVPSSGLKQPSKLRQPSGIKPPKGTKIKPPSGVKPPCAVNVAEPFEYDPEVLEEFRSYGLTDEDLRQLGNLGNLGDLDVSDVSDIPEVEEEIEYVPDAVDRSFERWEAYLKQLEEENAEDIALYGDLPAYTEEEIAAIAGGQRPEQVARSPVEVSVAAPMQGAIGGPVQVTVAAPMAVPIETGAAAPTAAIPAEPQMWVPPVHVPMIPLHSLREARSLMDKYGDMDPENLEFLLGSDDAGGPMIPVHQVADAERLLATHGQMDPEDLLFMLAEEEVVGRKVGKGFKRHGMRKVQYPAQVPTRSPPVSPVPWWEAETPSPVGPRFLPPKAPSPPGDEGFAGFFRSPRPGPSRIHVAETMVYSPPEYDPEGSGALEESPPHLSGDDGQELQIGPRPRVPSPPKQVAAPPPCQPVVAPRRPRPKRVRGPRKRLEFDFIEAEQADIADDYIEEVIERYEDNLPPLTQEQVASTHTPTHPPPCLPEFRIPTEIETMVPKRKSPPSKPHYVMPEVTPHRWFVEPPPAAADLEQSVLVETPPLMPPSSPPGSPGAMMPPRKVPSPLPTVVGQTPPFDRSGELVGEVCVPCSPGKARQVEQIFAGAGVSPAKLPPPSPPSPYSTEEAMRQMVAEVRKATRPRPATRMPLWFQQNLAPMRPIAEVQTQPGIGRMGLPGVVQVGLEGLGSGHLVEQPYVRSPYVPPCRIPVVEAAVCEEEEEEVIDDIYGDTAIPIPEEELRQVVHTSPLAQFKAADVTPPRQSPKLPRTTGAPMLDQSAISFEELQVYDAMPTTPLRIPQVTPKPSPILTPCGSPGYTPPCRPIYSPQLPAQRLGETMLSEHSGQSMVAGSPEYYESSGEYVPCPQASPQYMSPQWIQDAESSVEQEEDEMGLPGLVQLYAQHMVPIYASPTRRRERRIITWEDQPQAMPVRPPMIRTGGEIQVDALPVPQEQVQVDIPLAPLAPFVAKTPVPPPISPKYNLSPVLPKYADGPTLDEYYDPAAFYEAGSIPSVGSASPQRRTPPQVAGTASPPHTVQRWNQLLDETRHAGELETSLDYMPSPEQQPPCIPCSAVSPRASQRSPVMQRQISPAARSPMTVRSPQMIGLPVAQVVQPPMRQRSPSPRRPSPQLMARRPSPNAVRVPSPPVAARPPPPRVPSPQAARRPSPQARTSPAQVARVPVQRQISPVSNVKMPELSPLRMPRSSPPRAPCGVVAVRATEPSPEKVVKQTTTQRRVVTVIPPPPSVPLEFEGGEFEIPPSGDSSGSFGEGESNFGWMD